MVSIAPESGAQIDSQARTPTHLTPFLAKQLVTVRDCPVETSTPNQLSSVAAVVAAFLEVLVEVFW